MIPLIDSLGLEHGEMLALYFVIGLVSLIFLLRSVVFPSLNNGRPPATLKSLASFEIDEVLNHDQNYCAYRGFFYGDQSRPALVSIRQSSVNPQVLAKQAKRMALLKKPRKGAIFGYYSGKLVSKYFSLTGLLGLAMSNDSDQNNYEKEKGNMEWPWTIQVVYPWDLKDKSTEEKQSLFDKHYRKMQHKKLKMLNEDRQLYEKVTLPMIESIPESHTYWIKEIFDGKKETNATILKTDNCVMVVDPKWHGHINVDDYPDQSEWSEMMTESKIIRNMYLLCLSAPHLKWRSLRDLNTTNDLAILKQIRQDCKSAILKVYNINMDHDCRVFIHYHPQYYHFHIHITGLSLIFGQSMCAGRAYLLDDVIDNLSMDPLYYCNGRLKCMVPVDSDVYKAAILMEQGNDDDGSADGNANDDDGKAADPTDETN